MWGKHWTGKEMINWKHDRICHNKKICHPGNSLIEIPEKAGMKQTMEKNFLSLRLVFLLLTASNCSLQIKATTSACGKTGLRKAVDEVGKYSIWSHHKVIYRMYRNCTSSKYFPGKPGGYGESSGSKEGYHRNVSNCGAGALCFLIQCLHIIASCGRLCVCTNVFSRWRPTTRVLPLKCPLDSN